MICSLSCSTWGGKPVAYLASTIRNPQTYEFFITQLGKCQFMKNTFHFHLPVLREKKTKGIHQNVNSHHPFDDETVIFAGC